MSEEKHLELEEFFREIRKLEVRLGEYLEDEQVFVKKTQECIAQFKALHSAIEQTHVPVSLDEEEEVSKLTADAIEALSGAMKFQGKAEHEKSHLLESYGALIEGLQRIKKV
jgi:hypothetical protein